MSSGFHRLGANTGKLKDWSNSTLRANPHHLTLADVMRAREILDAAPIPVDEEQTPFDVGPAPVLMARMSGYTGDQCRVCNSMKMKMSGHCMVCEDCGETTGCS